MDVGEASDEATSEAHETRDEPNGARASRGKDSNDLVDADGKACMQHAVRSEMMIGSILSAQ